MADVRVEIEGEGFTEFSEFSIDADIFSMSDSFSFTGTSPSFATITAGLWCNIYVMGEQVMRGVVVTVNSTVSKKGRTFTFKGVDVCGLLDKVQMRRYKTLTNMGLIEAAKALTANLNWKGRLSFEVDGVAKKVGPRKEFIAEPGQSVADRLANLALLRGLTMFARPSGEIVFGRLASGGEPDHSLTVGVDGVTESSVERSILGGASEITVSSQEDESGSSRELYSVTVPGFPKIDLPICLVVESDDVSAPGLANSRMEEVKRGLFKYDATTVGFTCGNGKVWGINAVCRVTDSSHGEPINGDYLVISRSFSYSRSGGSTTKLSMGPLAEK